VTRIFFGLCSLPDTLTIIFLREVSLDSGGWKLAIPTGSPYTIIFLFGFFDRYFSPETSKAKYLHKTLIKNDYLSGKHLCTFVFLANMAVTYSRLTGLSNSDVLTFALCYKL